MMMNGTGAPRKFVLVEPDRLQQLESAQHVSSVPISNGPPPASNDGGAYYGGIQQQAYALPPQPVQQQQQLPVYYHHPYPPPTGTFRSNSSMSPIHDGQWENPMAQLLVLVPTRQQRNTVLILTELARVKDAIFAVDKRFHVIFFGRRIDGSNFVDCLRAMHNQNPKTLDVPGARLMVYTLARYSNLPAMSLQGAPARKLLYSYRSKSGKK